MQGKEGRCLGDEGNWPGEEGQGSGRDARGRGEGAWRVQRAPRVPVFAKPGARGQQLGEVELGEVPSEGRVLASRWPAGQVSGGHGCHGRKQRREKGEGLRRKFERKSGV